MFNAIANLHHAVFGGLQGALEDWFLGLFARLVFAAVLFFYFFNSAMTKIGEGGIFGHCRWRLCADVSQGF